MSEPERDEQEQEQPRQLPDCGACGNTGRRPHERSSGPPIMVNCSCGRGTPMNTHIAEDLAATRAARMHVQDRRRSWADEIARQRAAIWEHRLGDPQPPRAGHGDR